VKFDDYFRGWRSLSIDRINFMIVQEEATAHLLVKTGAADLGHQWFTVEAQEELAAEPHISLHLDPGVQLYHFPMNTQKAPTDDKNFRYAINYAFDYDTACNKIQFGAPQARGPVPIILEASSENAFQFQQNMTLAREYLAKSKYAADEYTLQYVYVAGIELERRTGLLLQANLAELGIALEIIPEPWGTITEIAATVEQTPHFTAIYDTLKFPHVDSHTYGLYHSTVPSTYRTMSHYNNPAVDALLDAARAAITEEEQMQKYKEAQDLLTLDAPSVYIFNTPHRVATWDYITGYTYVGLLGYDMAWWYLGLDIDLREMWSSGANMAEAELNLMQALVIVPTGHKQK
jgi:peptide/nickel transport system substrate-binding protein